LYAAARSAAGVFPALPVLRSKTGRAAPGSVRDFAEQNPAAQGIEAEIPQELRSNSEELERKSRFLRSKNAPKNYIHSPKYLDSLLFFL
jgi:hypothetical protein